MHGGEKKGLVLRRDSPQRGPMSPRPRYRRWINVVGLRREQPHSRQFFAGSRVSLVCNVCSRLLPKEWFAERPMASARANSRVPPPRHLCIIMLSPRTPALALPPSPRAAAPTRHCEKSAPFFLLVAAAVVPHPPPPSVLLVLPSAPTRSHFLSTLVSFRVGRRKDEGDETPAEERESERKGTKRNVSEARYAKVDKEKSAREGDGEVYRRRREKEEHTAMAKR